MKRACSHLSFEHINNCQIFNCYNVNWLCSETTVCLCIQMFFHTIFCLMSFEFCYTFHLTRSDSIEHHSILSCYKGYASHFFGSMHYYWDVVMQSSSAVIYAAHLPIAIWSSKQAPIQFMFVIKFPFLFIVTSIFQSSMRFDKRPEQFAYDLSLLKLFINFLSAINKYMYGNAHEADASGYIGGTERW